MKKLPFSLVLVSLVIILMWANETLTSAEVKPPEKVLDDKKFNEPAILSWFGSPEPISVRHKGNIILKTYNIGAFQLLIRLADNKVEQMEIVMRSPKSSPDNELFFALYVVTVTKKLLKEEEAKEVKTTLASGHLWEKNQLICREKYCFKRTYDHNFDILNLIVSPHTSGDN
jgi:hypothetical protein